LRSAFQPGTPLYERMGEEEEEEEEEELEEER